MLLLKVCGGLPLQGFATLCCAPQHENPLASPGDQVCQQYNLLTTARRLQVSGTASILNLEVTRL